VFWSCLVTYFFMYVLPISEYDLHSWTSLVMLVIFQIILKIFTYFNEKLGLEIRKRLFLEVNRPEGLIGRWKNNTERLSDGS
jgi:hypothetical protein